jgi:hypothetical protein
MAKLNKAGDAGSMGFLDIPQGDFREQVDIIADEMRQLAGNADVSTTAPTDPLNAPYTLYVNPYTGRDTFVGGQFNNLGDDLERRISNQRLECGYTEARPFKTVNRAAIEAAIITSRSFLSTDEDKTRALVTIQLGSGEHIVDNSNGQAFSSGLFDPISDGTEPTITELVRFNDQDKGAVILPRGCSLISLDLRKTVIRPAFVTGFEDEAADYSNRRSIFKVTGGGYYYGLTFKDNLEANETHHLLHCFEFASKAELDRLYEKVLAVFGSADINAANTQTQTTEFEIVGPKPLNPSDPTDTVASASPYIYNCSVRSVFGLGGVFANGDATDGFRSMVIAQFTGVSLQRDLRCWEQYNGNSWAPFNPGADADNPSTYEEYVLKDPNNIRMDPNKRSFHVRAVNDSIIQEVSVFAIGQGIHHWVESGGELTVTNSNSNFGGVAALAEGFRRIAQTFDTGYTAAQLRRPLDPFEFGPQVKEITLGFVETYDRNNLEIFLTNSLAPGRRRPEQPEILDSQRYSLKAGDFIWVENPNGPDYRSRIVSNGFNATVNDRRIRIQFPLQSDDESGNREPGVNADEGSFDQFLPAEKKRVYVRRYQDVRSPEERRCSFLITSSRNDNRLPVRDYILQPAQGSGVASWDERISTIKGSEVETESGDVRIQLGYVKRSPADNIYNADRFYRKGDVILQDNKHFTSLVDTITRVAGAFDPELWAENYVHMEEDYAPGGSPKNTEPILIFDFDRQEGRVTAEEFNLTGDGTTDPLIFAEPQFESGTDFIGAFDQLRNFGLTSGQALAALRPQPAASRDLTLRAGDYAGVGSFGFELRRPSNVRLFGHAWEWAGFLNYTKSLPDYQRTLSPDNKFTYFFTDQAGGRVFCAGFNEEGLQVSPRGLEDVTTGEILSADNLSSPDRELGAETSFDKLTVGELTVSSYGDNSRRASSTDEGFGIVRLYDANRTDNNAPTDVPTYADIERDFAKKQANVLPFQIFHVIPNVRVINGVAVPDPGTTLLTGTESIPFGFTTTPRQLRWEPDQPFSTTITEALAEAAKVFVPAGSTILISVHGSRPAGEIEQGPLQLANGFAPVFIAGARGAGVNDPDGQGQAPKIVLNRAGGQTKNALGRTPQYSQEYAFSAGVTFADLRLECECDGRANTLATVNGGFGVGKFDTTITWINSQNVAACATTYGQSTVFQFYGGDNTSTVFKQELLNWVRPSGGDTRNLQFFGAGGGSGLVSQGCDIVIDFRDDGTGSGGSNPEFTFAFDARRTDGQPTDVGEVAVNFVAAGGRGGVQHGGRSRPIIGLDFSGKQFFVKDFVNEDSRQSQNYFGESFRFKRFPLASDVNAPNNFNLAPASAAAFFTDIDNNGPVLLKNGCCLDIKGETNTNRRAGPFSFYLEVEEADNRPSGNVLAADNSTNSFIYNGGNARNIN